MKCISVLYRGHWRSESSLRNSVCGIAKFGEKELHERYSVNTKDVWKETAFIRFHSSSVHNTEKFSMQDKLRVRELADWTAKDGSRKNHDNGSLSDSLEQLNPNHTSITSAHYSKLPPKYWMDDNNQRNALEKLGKRKLGVKELDDWYSVSISRVKKQLGFIKKYYNGSLLEALKHLYPQHNWDQSRFIRQPPKYWTDESNQRAALEKLGRKLGVKELDDWYSVSSEKVHTELSFIGNYYNGSLFNALKSLYPHHSWDRFRFSNVPMKYWTDENTQRDALEKLGREKFGVKELDDWYYVTPENVRQELSFVGNYYNGSLYETLKHLYPQHNWNRMYFSRGQNKSWMDAQREVLERYGRERLGVRELDDWYSVPAMDVRNELDILKRYGSLYDALKHLYPEHEWDPLRFSAAPKGYWQHPETIQHYRSMFTAWKNEHNIRTLSQWYKLSPQQVNLFERASKGIFGNRIKMLEEWFPEIEWEPQPSSDLEVQRNALDRLGSKLGVKELDDWYNVSGAEVARQLWFVKKYGSLFNALKRLYPSHEWDPLRFPTAPKGYWQHPETIQHYYNLFTAWKNEYNIRTVKDWYQLPIHQVEQFERASMRLFGGKMKMLQRWFPEIAWQHQFASQLELHNLVKNVIADATVRHYSLIQSYKKKRVIKSKKLGLT